MDKIENLKQGYMDLLLSAVQKELKVEVMDLSGTWQVEYKEHYFYATPLWDGFEELPIAMLDEEYQQLGKFGDLVPFNPTENIQEDAKKYIEIFKTIADKLIFKFKKSQEEK